MKRVGLSPYGIIQAPCRQMSLHPVPFPRVMDAFVGAGGVFDGTNWFCVVSFIYPVLGGFNFYCDPQPSIVVNAQQTSAMNGGPPYLGLVGGELWNFYLKPRIEFFD
jgi:hypothetical protein